MGVTLAVAYVSHSVIAGDWGLLVLAGDAMLAIAAGLVLAAYRLWIACRIHLRLEDAFATVLASQVITILLMPIVVFVLPKALL
jgi:hypothetical protein